MPEVLELPLSQVRPDPEQHRQVFPDEYIQGLAESIRGQGQLTPVRVRPDPEGEGGRYMIVDGECRYRACVLGGLPTIRAEVCADLSESQIADAQGAANLSRRDVEPTAAGRALRRSIDALRREKPWLSEDDARKTVQNVYGLTGQFVIPRLRLLGLPPEVQALVDSKGIGIETGLALLRLVEKGETAEAIRLGLSARANSLTLNEVNDQITAYLTRDAQGSMFGANEGRATKEQRATRDVLSRIVSLFEQVQRVAFDERKQEFRLGDLGESELEAAEAKLSGAAKTTQALLAEVRRAQGKVEEVPARVAPSPTASNEALRTREEPEGASPPAAPEEAKGDSPLRVRMERDWLWVYDAPGPGESPLSWKLYRAGARWAKSRGAWYAPTPRDIENVRAVLQANPVKGEAA